MENEEYEELEMEGCDYEPDDSNLEMGLTHILAATPMTAERSVYAPSDSNTYMGGGHCLTGTEQPKEIAGEKSPAILI